MPNLSVFDLFTIGIGPSSSHSVGPMRAANRFVGLLGERWGLGDVEAVRAELFGSLALTGKGHGTDKAVLLGLEGETPEEVETDSIDARVGAVRDSGWLALGGEKRIAFREAEHLLFHRHETLPEHSNAAWFSAFDAAGEELVNRVYYSVGGGFVLDEEESQEEPQAEVDRRVHPFETGGELLAIARETDQSVSEIMLANEMQVRGEEEIRTRLLGIWEAMRGCAERGCRAEGVLPGRLGIARRAPRLYEELSARTADDGGDPLEILDWVNLYALAVNEENAAGGRVVTAPTNGAAGIIPAVLHYYERFCAEASEEGIVRFLLTAGAIAMLYKKNASISGAEVGCQGEVGVACSMAAGALVEVLGGSVAQVEQAAEIGMEHNLGLTCDPIAGLVQVPCIERNAMGAVKAINAARLALQSDGEHFVSLDRVIAVMRRTGADMSTKYKETSRGGLAVNVSEC
ncbi:MAG: L-serine ammonia-lyase [Planctomycetaceae bacterium]|nr:L-serine ammonia-lyase [Planctomycetaceae bacterium]